MDLFAWLLFPLVGTSECVPLSYFSNDNDYLCNILLQLKSIHVTKCVQSALKVELIFMLVENYRDLV